MSVSGWKLRRVLLSSCVFLVTVTVWGQNPTLKRKVPDTAETLSIDQPNLRSGDPEIKKLKSMIEAGNWAGARTLTEQLEIQHPQQAHPHYWSGYVQLRQHDPIGAIRSLRKAERGGLQDPSLAKVLGLAYYAINQFTLFREQMQKAISAAPDDPWPHYYLGLYELQIRENYGEALGHFTSAAAVQPNDATILYHRGFCNEMLDHTDRALHDYQESIRLVEQSNERFSPPYQGMAYVLATTDPAQASRYAQRAIEMDPGIANNHLTLAKIHENQGDLEKAIQALQNAVRADPTLPRSHYRLHRIFTKLGDPSSASDALAEFQRLTKLYGP